MCMSNRVGGYIDKLISCINPRKKKYAIFWDKRADAESEGNFTFMQHIFDHKPTLEEIKGIIIAWYNSKIDCDIISGFVWNDLPVWLSIENQFNYKAAFDAAVMSNGATLPVTFKFGTDDEPVYHQFTDMEELQDFYFKGLAYKQSVLESGWKEKDEINWDDYVID